MGDVSLALLFLSLLIGLIFGDVRRIQGHRPKPNDKGERLEVRHLVR